MSEYIDYHTPDGGKTYHYGTDNPAECDECRQADADDDNAADWTPAGQTAEVGKDWITGREDWPMPKTHDPPC